MSDNDSPSDAIVDSDYTSHPAFNSLKGYGIFTKDDKRNLLTPFAESNASEVFPKWMLGNNSPASKILSTIQLSGFDSAKRKQNWGSFFMAKTIIELYFLLEQALEDEDHKVYRPAAFVRKFIDKVKPVIGEAVAKTETNKGRKKRKQSETYTQDVALDVPCRACKQFYDSVECSMKSEKAVADAASKSLLRLLSFYKVKFLRYVVLDVCNNVRCKVVPLQHLKNLTNGEGSLDPSVAIAKVCIGGLPSFADRIQSMAGLSAQHSLFVEPDLSTIRVLPWATESAVVLGNLIDHRNRVASDLCCRSLLRRVIQKAASQLNIFFTVGAELEFILFDAKTHSPVDFSNFADTTILEQQKDFIESLYNDLTQQDIAIELIHAESAPGQLEIVLSYQNDPVVLVDNVLLAQQTIRSAARRFGLKAIFLPKTDPMQAGSGLHLHLSFYDVTSGTNKFGRFDNFEIIPVPEAADFISGDGQSFIEGILNHLPPLLALTLPTKNSFLRVGPGCWTGSEVNWAFDDKESGLRVVATKDNGRWERVEYKFCDSTANLYLALSGILLAGMDGISNKMPLRSLFENKQAVAFPSSLEKSLKLLDDSEFFKSALPPSMLQSFVALRRAELEHGEDMDLDDELEYALKKAL